MNVLIAIDSFKGSLSSLEAGRAAEIGVRRVFEDAQVDVVSVADGGEGTVKALVEGMGGRLERVAVSDPLGRKITAQYGLIPQKKTAIIEMSAAAGITLISAEERDPLKTTTYGVGEMIVDALQKGAREFIVGIGGSATNDGGMGMLRALGYEFLDEKGDPVVNGGSGLEFLREIRNDAVIPELSKCSFHIACDVKNPLCGDNGCSAVFGPQKGATADTVAKMDAWLMSYATCAGELCEGADPNYPGCGAAGGLGFAFRTFLGGELVGGIDLVLRSVGFDSMAKDADVVITGEGRLDAQTVMGKVPVGVAAVAKRYCRPVIAFSGAVTADVRLCNDHGIDAFFPILRKIATLEEAMEPSAARNNMADTVEQAFRLLRLNVNQ